MAKYRPTWGRAAAIGSLRFPLRRKAKQVGEYRHRGVPVAKYPLIGCIYAVLEFPKDGPLWIIPEEGHPYAARRS